MTTRFFRALAHVVTLAVLLGVQSASASELDLLLDLLIKKHVVTEEEAGALRGEVAQEKATPAQEARRELAHPPQKPPGELAKNEPLAANGLPFEAKGFVQTRWSNEPGKPNTLQIRRARLILNGKLADKISYYVQADGVRSPFLLDASVDFAYVPFAKLTFGQFKIPFSQENLISDDKWMPIERSMIGNSLVPGRDTGNQGRDIGVQVSGSSPAWHGRPLLTYAVGLFNGNGISTLDVNNRKDFASRVVFNPVDGLSLAGDYYDGATGTTKLAKQREGVELAYIRQPVSVYSEYIWGRDGAVRKSGWYSLLVYRLNPKWEGIFRLENYNPDRHTPNKGTNLYMGGLNWYLNKWVKWGANYGLSDQAASSHLTSVFLTQVQFSFQLTGKKGGAGE
ncbi:MAG: OprO/OprP family phosphate-selective porin [Acidobacteriia bacterium]|nr:OprO/OprP family phosphate-selective porin [Terriglobia bacterium]